MSQPARITRCLAQVAKRRLKHLDAPAHGEKLGACIALRIGNSTRLRSNSRSITSKQIGYNPFTGYQPVRSTLGVRWSHGNLQPLRHPGLPALLQVIHLGANGGRLKTRRCRRRTNRAATTRASPSERMLLRLRRSMTRLDPKRARRRRHDVLPCSRKYSINKQLHSGQSS